MYNFVFTFLKKLFKWTHTILFCDFFFVQHYVFENHSLFTITYSITWVHLDTELTAVKKGSDEITTPTGRKKAILGSSLRVCRLVRVIQGQGAREGGQGGTGQRRSRKITKSGATEAWEGCYFK